MRIILALALCFPLLSGAPNEEFQGNQFANAYNVWAHLYNSPHQQGTVNASEIKAWHDTQRAWKDLNNSVHYE